MFPVNVSWESGMGVQKLLLSLLVLIGCAPEPCPDGFARDNAGNCVQIVDAIFASRMWTQIGDA